MEHQYKNKGLDITSEHEESLVVGCGVMYDLNDKMVYLTLPDNWEVCSSSDARQVKLKSCLTDKMMQHHTNVIRNQSNKLKELITSVNNSSFQQLP